MQSYDSEPTANSPRRSNEVRARGSARQRQAARRAKHGQRVSPHAVARPPGDGVVPPNARLNRPQNAVPPAVLHKRAQRNGDQRRAARAAARAPAGSGGGVLHTLRSGLRALPHSLTWSLIGGQVALVLLAGVGLVLAFVIMLVYMQGTVLPGVSAAGIGISGMDAADAARALNAAWANQSLTLRDGDRTWQVSPAELGIRLDGDATAREAIRYGRDEGGLGAMLGAAILGHNIEPVVEVDFDAAQAALLHYASLVELPPQNASVRMQNGVVVHVEARNGRQLNLSVLLPALAADPGGMLKSGVIDLPMLTVAPVITDATPLLEYAQTLLQYPLQVEAYDPVSDQVYQLGALPQQWGEWLDTRLVYHDTGPRLYLSVSTARVSTYLQAQSDALPAPLRLDIGEGVQAIQEAVGNGTLSTWVTVRYDPTVYVVQRGDSAYGISRTEGIPFYLIQQANPDRDLERLSPGDELTLPSRDVMLPLRPVRHKRIVVDLSDQYMWAYENGQVLYEWGVSTGRSDAPTSTGVFQVLSHEPLAYGSGFALCNADTLDCGQWVMHWFMGVYEAVPGLMNGFHGAVELPNGGYLGGGSVGYPVTFGCIMALEDNAEQLYNWADEGTVVEIRL